MNTAQKPPSWATLVGVLGICFGVLGLIGGGYELMMPMMLSMQGRMMESMKESAKEAAKKPRCPENGKTAQPDINPDAMFESMKEFMTVPPWHTRFAYANGSLQLVLGALYILSSIFLMLLKRGAAMFFLAVASLSALRNIVAFGVGIYAGSFMAFWSVISGAGGLLIDLVLLIVVAVSDRSMYRRTAVE